ncbi:hypothetical protein BH23VER1_BH23VER1_29010 [soil metagenome]
MAKGWAEEQSEQSAHHGTRILPLPVSSSLLAIAARRWFIGSDAVPTARPFEEPCAGKPHRICEGGPGNGCSYLNRLKNLPMDNPLTLAAVGLAMALAIYLFVRSKRDSSPSELMPDEEGGFNLAVLLPEPFSFSERAFREALSEALGGDYSSDDDERFITPVIESAQYLVKVDETTFIFHNRAEPYFPDKEAVAGTIEGDDELASAIRAHSAWISFDSLSSENSEKELYNMMGSVLARLAPKNASALFLPDRGTLIRFDENRRKQLAGGKTLRDLGFEDGTETN